jgi:hypothetical protein
MVLCSAPGGRTGCAECQRSRLTRDPFGHASPVLAERVLGFRAATPLAIGLAHVADTDGLNDHRPQGKCAHEERC